MAGTTNGRAGAGAGQERTNEVLLQLSGEILLRTPPSRQPPIVRAGAAVGLELLDLLLNPDHILRVTEELTLRNSLMLARRVRVDISLDRLSRQQEEGAAQLSALVTDRVGLDVVDRVVSDRDGPDRMGARSADDRWGMEWSGQQPVGGRLWLPLDTVPRPISVAVEVTEMDGTPLPRPPQREVARALDAALYHVLRESLRTHPDFEREGTPVNQVMRCDDAARWLLQKALLAVATSDPGSPRGQAREEAVQAMVGPVDPTVAGDEQRTLLGKLASGADLPAQQMALRVLRDALCQDGPFLELLGLVHRHYFVVVGLDRSVRDHSVQFELPESEAQDSSVIRRLVDRSRRTFDPREHNYTIRVKVPLPDNVRQYNLPVSIASENGNRSSSEVSLIGAVHFDDHPGRPALDALLTCADVLTASTPGPARAMSVRFVAHRAVTAVQRLEDLVEAQEQAATDLKDRWGDASTWTVDQSVTRLRKVTKEAREDLRTAREHLAGVLANGDAPTPAPHLEPTTQALRQAAATVGHPLLWTRLVCNEVAGQDVARIRLHHATLVPWPGPRPRELEVWATVSDEAVPYGYSALGPPLSLAGFVYVTGKLVFGTWFWIWPWDHLVLRPATIATGSADAIVAVLLLIPAFAMTQFRIPDRWSVAGRLRRPARLFVLTAIATLGITAMVVATQVGSTDSAEAAGHPSLVLGVLRGALGVFLGWAAWAFVASALRRLYAWRPKGLKDHFGVETFVRAARPTRRGRRLRRWLGTRLTWVSRAVRFLRYDSKAPDADFDLTQPTRPFPSRRRAS